MLIVCDSKLLDEKLIDNLAQFKRIKKFLTVFRQLRINKDDLFSVENIMELYKNSFDFISIDNCDLSDKSDEELVDIFLGIATIPVPTYIVGCDNRSREIENIINSLEIKNIVLCKDYRDDMDLVKIDNVDIGIINEIFEGDFAFGGFDVVDFLLRLYLIPGQQPYMKTLQENGIIRLETELYSSKNLNLILKEELNIKISLLNSYISYPFSFNIYEPLLQETFVLGDLLEYKWKVFEKVKKFNPTNMKILPKEVISFCNRNEFIPFKDVLDVIEGEYPFLKYYIEEV